MRVLQTRIAMVEVMRDEMTSVVAYSEVVSPIQRRTPTMVRPLVGCEGVHSRMTPPPFGR
jgi:hypothetical protein